MHTSQIAGGSLQQLLRCLLVAATAITHVMPHHTVKLTLQQIVPTNYSTYKFGMIYWIWLGFLLKEEAKWRRDFDNSPLFTTDLIKYS